MANKNEKIEARYGFVLFDKSGKPKRDDHGNVLVFYGQESDIKRYAREGEQVKYAKVGLKETTPDVTVRNVEKETAWVYAEPRNKVYHNSTL
ncbi:MAG: hypothetical protein QME47_05995 [Candidatus Thermoplasmatota archaeon]|nr:hypothetical protein [Candidatus Thermoplasmatota archaeon]